MNALELEYNNRIRLPHAAATIQQWAHKAQTYRSASSINGRAEIDLRYGATPNQTIDIFWPQEDTAKHICVFVHGGYWQLFNPSFFSHIAEGVNRNGMPMALIGYDLCPEVDIETIIAQVRSACSFIWRRHGRRLVMSGHSAGGHLTAAMMSEEQTDISVLPPDAIVAGVAISGVFELKPLLDTSINEKLGLDDNRAHDLSPTYWRPRPRVLIDAWVGANESSEFHRQSREFTEAWTRAGANVRLETVSEADHFGAIAPLCDPNSDLTRRLIEIAR